MIKTPKPHKSPFKNGYPPEYMTKWSEAQRYAYVERIGILCGSGHPTEEQMLIAYKQAAFMLQ